MTTSAFDLPDNLSFKAAPELVADDDRHLALVARTVAESVARLSERLEVALRAPGKPGQEGMDRDLEITRLSTRRHTLQRYGLDLCLGRTMATDGTVTYVGRIGLSDADDRRLLVDWRSPAAEPFFAATRAEPRGLLHRRRYRWSSGAIVDYWDEVLADDAESSGLALDDQSAFIASLGSDRSQRMRDVLGTIAADQDAIIRAGADAALVVDGGPGTGKTVVALHRTAYLLYSDARLEQRGGVLVVGPHRPYLAYVGDVLPSLGEEGVQLCTLRDLVAEGASAGPEPDLEVARLKSSVAMVQAIEAAVRFYEEPPTASVTVSSLWDEVALSPAEWADAFRSADAGATHNEAREQVWDELLDLLVAKHDEDVPEEPLRRSLAQDPALRTTFDAAWPLLEATDVVGDLWRVPAYLRLCAPWLTPDEVRLLQRDDPSAWTVADLPLLDAARRRLGDPEAALLRRRHEAAAAAERARMDRVVDELLLADEHGMFAQLRQPALRDALVDPGALPGSEPDLLAGPFAHLVVDEAQELTDAEWQMLLARCPSRSLTVVGDRAQARHGFLETWQARLDRVGLGAVEIASLGINYRTPSEVMAEAEPLIREALPDANVPTSIRSTGVPVEHRSRAELEPILERWLSEHAQGVACVVGDPSVAPSPRVSSLTPELVKGLEFDLVVLVDPERFGDGIEGAVDRYVAMTRATQRLVVLTTE